MTLKLTDRMQVIADFVCENESVADIGTDHGYIPIWLLANARCRSAVMADVNQGPLDKAAENCALYLPDMTEPDLRLGSGIEVLEAGETDTVIIAGMGGILITDILSIDKEKTLSLKKLILQPRNNSDVLRRWVNEELDGFYITDERVVKEGHKYSEILCVKSENILNENDRIKISDAEHVTAGLIEQGVDADFLYEFPAMYITQSDETVHAYLSYKLAVQNEICERIRANGSTESASAQLEALLKRSENIALIREKICKKLI